MLPVSDRWNIIHKNIGADRLEVKENTIEKKHAQHGDIQGATSSLEIQHENAGRNLNSNGGNTGVKLQLSWPVRITWNVD